MVGSLILPLCVSCFLIMAWLYALRAPTLLNKTGKWSESFAPLTIACVQCFFTVQLRRRSGPRLSSLRRTSSTVDHVAPLGRRRRSSFFSVSRRITASCACLGAYVTRISRRWLRTNSLHGPPRAFSLGTHGITAATGASTLTRTGCIPPGTYSSTRLRSRSDEPPSQLRLLVHRTTTTTTCCRFQRHYTTGRRQFNTRRRWHRPRVTPLRLRLGRRPCPPPRHDASRRLRPHLLPAVADASPLPVQHCRHAMQRRHRLHRHRATTPTRPRRGNLHRHRHCQYR